MTVNCAGDHRNDAAGRADMELGGLRPEGIPRRALGILDADRQGTCGAGRPHAAMFSAERARAGPGSDLFRLGLPVQLERDVAAVAGSRNEHGGSPVGLPKFNYCLGRDIRRHR